MAAVGFRVDIASQLCMCVMSCYCLVRPTSMWFVKWWSTSLRPAQIEFDRCRTAVKYSSKASQEDLGTAEQLERSQRSRCVAAQGARTVKHWQAGMERGVVAEDGCGEYNSRTLPAETWPAVKIVRSFTLGNVR